MKPSDAFALEILPTQDEDETPRARLIHCGQAVGEPVEGCILEQQYAVDANRYLLFVSDDIPYEEGLHIYLVDAAGAVLDGLEIGAPYTPGLLEDVVASGPDKVDFSFIHKQRCRVIVHAEPAMFRRLWPIIGVKRLGGVFRKHHLELQLMA
ncbi:MAG: hypothetical protein OEU09_20405 [Rhodospirillales bacterium]|nr:hypothetical protein [Rhodospirillales bacterium]MDH3790966.1 hypothetical protein [Rhodospirillales bacterium]MDH3913647.1 hypothetical protein [Rhodospirillales bacterium]MDH3921015.1 hypothetical protein [Rhodospirillales bacterium]MDH3969222.1 hypothetical protein [Rhodospirillales bacterium]